MELASATLAGEIPELCLLVEREAMILRLNSLERPSSSCIELDSVRDEASQIRQTLAEEYLMLCSQNGNFLKSAYSGDVHKIAALFSNCGLKMNNEKHHAFWARLARLKTNARTFADMYE